MDRLFFSTLLLFFISISNALYPNLEKNGYAQEKKVLEEAQKENKPIILAFLREDCPWSEKMKMEILDHSDFKETIHDKALFWKILLGSQESLNGVRLREKFKIDKCPMILLLDPKGIEFARFDDLTIDAKAFAARILQVTSDFRGICRALDKNEDPCEAKKWEELYQKAKQLSSTEIKKIVLERGLKEGGGIDLLLEKYVFLLESKKLKDKSVRECREQLLRRDPENRFGTHFKIAMADFYKLDDSRKTKKNPKKALRPLLHYLHCFETKDKENAWKAQWAAARYLFAVSMRERALSFAQKAHQQAPEEIKESIAEWITLL